MALSPYTQESKKTLLQNVMFTIFFDNGKKVLAFTSQARAAQNND
jgi:hypothetical protein